MPLINCKINLILTWPVNCFTIDVTVYYQVPTFALTDTKLYALVVTYWHVNCYIIDAPVNYQVPTFALTDTKLYALLVTLST